MSQKLNAEELAAKRYGINNDDPTPFGSQMMSWDANKANGYIAAIEEVAQPLADERDELREALRDIERLMTSMQPMGYFTNHEWSKRLSAARNVLAKYPKP